MLSLAQAGEKIAIHNALARFRLEKAQAERARAVARGDRHADALATGRIWRALNNIIEDNTPNRRAMAAGLL